MQFTGELGGLWRRMGHAPQKVAGTGFTAQGFDRAEPYRRTQESEDPRAAFIFDGIKRDEVIGNFGLVGGGAAGWEIDRIDFALGTPPHTLVVAIADTFRPHMAWGEKFNHSAPRSPGDVQPLVRCDVVFFECERRRGVLDKLDLWGGSLSHKNYDNNVGRIMENVVRASSIRRRFRRHRAHETRANRAGERTMRLRADRDRHRRPISGAPAQVVCGRAPVVIADLQRKDAESVIDAIRRLW
jgi:N,N-dimethylformamidase